VIGRLQSTSQFYEVILGGCGNGIIREVLQGLIARINFLRARSMSRPGRAKHSATELRKILLAIEKKDAEGARAAADGHVKSACAAAREVFEPHVAV
jgi:DNA-binding GntR family transcriptional regulator